MEKWKPVVDFESLYEVSNLGRVRNCQSRKILKQEVTRSGYLKVFLYKNKQRKCKAVHRLVALSFLGIPSDEKMQVNHKDLNKKNNSLENLEWCTPSYNVHHSWVNGGRIKNKKSLMKVLRKPIEQRTLDGKLIKTWISLSEAARALGLSVSNICACSKGRIKSTGGYKWIVCSDT